MEHLGAQRIREMDEAGIDVRVLSHAPPGSQGVREDVAVAWTKAANDRLHTAVQVYPTRFAGFASLPTAHPQATADEALSRDTPMKNFREVFISNFYVTTSGFFSDPVLQCCITEMGIDRIMFSVDWPYASNIAGANWIRKTWLDDADKAKIMSGNARRLLRI